MSYFRTEIQSQQQGVIHRGDVPYFVKYGAVTASASGATTIIAAPTVPGQQIVVLDIAVTHSATVNWNLQSHTTTAVATGLFYGTAGPPVSLGDSNNGIFACAPVRRSTSIFRRPPRLAGRSPTSFFHPPEVANGIIHPHVGSDGLQHRQGQRQLRHLPARAGTGTVPTANRDSANEYYAGSDFASEVTGTGYTAGGKTIAVAGAAVHHGQRAPVRGGAVGNRLHPVDGGHARQRDLRLSLRQHGIDQVRDLRVGLRRGSDGHGQHVSGNILGHDSELSALVLERHLMHGRTVICIPTRGMVSMRWALAYANLQMPA